jgi:hypothetical protein
MSAIRFFLIGLFSLTFNHFAGAAEVCEFQRFNDVTFQGCTDFTFSHALETGDIEKIIQLIEKEPKYVFACNQNPEFDQDQYSSLTYAVCRAKNRPTLPAIVKYLLQNGANPTCRSQVLKVTALECANNIQNPEIKDQVVELLLAAGADRVGSR